MTDWFAERSLRIVSMRSKGVCLEGDEYSFRIAIRDYMMDMMPEVLEALLGTFAPGVEVTRIRNIIVDAENAWRIELADNSFKMVWIMTCVSLARRSKTGKFLQAKEDNIQNYNEYSFSESIYQRIEKEYRSHTSEAVSYTHLVGSVSTARLKVARLWLQLPSQERTGKSMIRKRYITRMASWQAVSASPVSYTHLDVYKRQAGFGYRILHQRGQCVL